MRDKGRRVGGMLAGRGSRRKLLRRAMLASVGTALAIACGQDGSTGAMPPPRADGPPSAPGDARALVQPGTPPVAFAEVDVRVARSDISRFLQETLDEHQTYFATVREQQGDDAAQGEIAAVSTPYQERLDELQASGQQTITLRVPLVTLWGAFTFSATAYEGPLIVKDPVSVLFYWNGDAARIYERSVEMLTCRPNRDDDACRDFPRFQDDDDRQGIPGHPFRCHTSPQWVLMGNAGGPLQWVRDVGGLMKTSDRCNRVGRDHIRVFGGPAHPVFGAWSVATPHRERFSFDPLPGRGGHIITSWNGAQRLYAGAWLESRLSGDRPGWDPSVFYWDWFDWGTAGDYQKIRFDGHGFLIGVTF